MRTFSAVKSVAVTLAIILTTSLPASAGSINYDQIFIFGDSLSDSGNAFNATGGAFPPDPPYVQGRFSSGPNWIDNFTASLGLNPTLVTDPALNPVALPSDGINFAFGGATSGNTTIADVATGNPALGFLPGLEQQIAAFQSLYDGPASPDPDALFVLWIGGNDYFFNVNDPATVLSNIANAISALSALGAENFMVANLPDLGQTPFADLLGVPGAPEALSALTDAHNLGLDQLLASLEGNFSLLDVHDLFNQALADPTAFGFSDAEHGFLLACFDNGVFICDPGTIPDDFVYWDEVHPTAPAHRELAKLALALISVPEPGSLLLLSVGLLGLGIAGRRRKAVERTSPNGPGRTGQAARARLHGPG